MEKQGVSKETIEKLNQYDKPCTILETVKLSRAIAEDVVTEAFEEYRRASTGTIVALTLQVELLKKLMIEKFDVITEEELQSMYQKEAEVFEEKQREYLNAMKQAEAEHLQREESSMEPDNIVDFRTNVASLHVDVVPEED